MIDPKELRIGNYLFDKDWDAVRAIGATDIYNIAIKGSDNYDPIELKPEWLEKFGFIDPAKNGLAYRKEINLADEFCWYVQDGFLRYQTIGSGFTRARMHIKQVHQLQNFFYWHTGKELEITNQQLNK